MEVFCVHAEKLLIMILDKKNPIDRDVDFFCVRAQKFVKVVLDNKVFQRIYARQCLGIRIHTSRL